MWLVCNRQIAEGVKMKIGDLVKHRDGTLGVIIDIENAPRFEYRVRFTDGDVDWFFWSWLELVDENR